MVILCKIKPTTYTAAFGLVLFRERHQQHRVGLGVGILRTLNSNPREWGAPLGSDPALL